MSGLEYSITAILRAGILQEAVCVVHDGLYNVSVVLAIKPK
jgi:hypothetical protein